MNSEQIIKQALDGNFWSLSQQGDRICWTRVPNDFIPDHSPASWDTDMSAVESGRRGGLARRRPWTLEEDERLIELRAQKLRWQVVGRALGRGDKQARLRYFEICEQRGLTPVCADRDKAVVLTADIKSRIVELHEQKCMSFDEINAVLGLEGFKARDYYSRYRREVFHSRHIQEAA